MNNLNIEGAVIGFKNFSGKETKYNAAGNRNFSIFIDDVDTAEQLKADGWNVKVRKSKNDNDEELKFHLPVTIKFTEYYRPKVFQITSSGKTLLTEETLGLLDYSVFENVDISIKPHEWEVNGQRGIKAYVDAMYVTIQEDYFAERYSNINTSPIDGIEEEIPF